MPINSGRKGFAGVLGVPALRRASSLDPQAIMQATGGGPMGSGVLRNGKRNLPFHSPPLSTQPFVVSGTTYNNVGAPLANCVVKMFASATDLFIAETISDGSGLFSFGATAGPYFLVAWGPTGTVAGVTLDTLSGV